MSGNTSILDIMKYVTLAGGAIGVLYGAGGWVYDMTALLSTKQYHDESLQRELDARVEPMKQSLDQVEAAVAVPRINNILDLKCKTQGDVPQEVESILRRTMERYREIEGRDFDTGYCLPNGKRISTYEARQRNLVD